MTARARRIQAILAGLGAFLVDVWPVLLIAWAGASGSVGDLSEVPTLGIGLTYGILIGVLAGWLMNRALVRASRSPWLRPADAWGAYALAMGLYTLGLTLVPALIYGLLLTDENMSLRGRFWLIALLWIGGHVAAAAISVLAASVLLGREPTPSTSSAR